MNLCKQHIKAKEKQMNKYLIIAGLAGAMLSGCKGAEGNYPGDVYAPDMYYSRAYEANGYNTTDQSQRALAERKIHYNGLPVEGTIARGENESYKTFTLDTSTAKIASYKDLAPEGLTVETRREAERIYQIQCAICHGTNLDGNGPLWKGGDGPYPAAPRNLKDDYTKKLSDGQIYHAIVYGKNLMGPYGTQVHEKARWWIVKYIREKQSGGAPVVRTDTTANTATSPTISGAADSTSAQTK